MYELSGYLETKVRPSESDMLQSSQSPSHAAVATHRAYVHTIRVRIKGGRMSTCSPDDAVAAAAGDASCDGVVYAPTDVAGHHHTSTSSLGGGALEQVVFDWDHGSYIYPVERGAAGDNEGIIQWTETLRSGSSHVDSQSHDADMRTRPKRFIARIFTSAFGFPTSELSGTFQYNHGPDSRGRPLERTFQFSLAHLSSLDGRRYPAVLLRAPRLEFVVSTSRSSPWDDSRWGVASHTVCVGVHRSWRGRCVVRFSPVQARIPSCWRW